MSNKVKTSEKINHIIKTKEIFVPIHRKDVYLIRRKFVLNNVFGKKKSFSNR